ncbi:CD2 antigen cytoplasmic tail-binding protein 2 homolog holn1 [Cochliomyia hominivorax]
MAAKRKYNFSDVDDNLEDIHLRNKKNTLDSDEEDSDDHEKCDNFDAEVLGEEEGISKVRDEVKFTPFNIREELETGHFDKDGHYHWNKSNDIQDNWLDNIDWVKIEKEKEISKDVDPIEYTADQTTNICNIGDLYKQMLSYMNKGETVASALLRLGKNRTKMSSLQRLKLKQQGIIDAVTDEITKLTEIANEILTKTGNMDIYQETFESINKKIEEYPGSSSKCNPADPKFDLYSDDFNEKENDLLKKCTKEKETDKNYNEFESSSNEILWEFKWKEEDDILEGPFNTQQMLKWSKNRHFKNGVYVRKVGELTNFYKSNRIDFELYL